MSMPSTSSEPQNKDAILFMNGDNYIFPVTYGRLVERMREDVDPVRPEQHSFQDAWSGEGNRSAEHSVGAEEERDGEKDHRGESGERLSIMPCSGPMPSTCRSSHELIPEGVLYRVFQTGKGEPS